MRRERRDLDPRPPEAEACRLPPGRLRRIDSVRSIAKEIHLRHLVRRYARELVIVGMCFSLLLALAVSGFSDYSPQMSISEVSPLTGTRGVTATNQSCQSVTLAHLINTTSFDYRNGWTVDVWRFHESRAPYDSSPNEEGFRVTLVGSRAQFERCLFLPIQYYERIDASLEVRGLSGSANVSLSLDITFKNGSNMHDDAVIGIIAGQTECLAVSLLPGDLEALDSQEWFWHVWIVVSLFAEEQAEALIGGLDVNALSSQALTPLTVDLQTTDGHSLLSDPYHPRGVLSEEDSLFLLLELLRLDDEKQATVVAQVANETFYLPAGNYSMKAEWSPDYTWSEYLDYESADLSILENQTTFLRIRLPSVLVNIELTQYSVAGYIQIDAALYGRFYDYQIDTYMRSSFYIPAGVTQMWVSVFHYTPWGHTGYAYGSYELDGFSDLLLTIQYPYVVFLGVVTSGLDTGIILQSAILVVALLVRLRHGFLRARAESVLGDPCLVPLLLVLVGAFLPWFRYDYVSPGGTYMNHDDYHALQFAGVFFPPLAVLTRQTPSGMTAPYVLETWFLTMPLFVAFFWIPILGMACLIGTQQISLSWRRLVSVAFPSVMTLMSALVLAVLSWVAPVGLWMVPDVGLWLILLSPVVFLIQIGIRRVLIASGADSMKT